MAVSPCRLCTSAQVAKEAGANSTTSGGVGGWFRETDHEKQTSPAHEPNFTYQRLTTRSRPSTRGQFQRPGTMLIPSMMQANSTTPRGLSLHGQGTRTPCLQEVTMWQCLGSAAVLASWPEWFLRINERIMHVAMVQHFNSRIHQTSVRTEVPNTKWANHHTWMELTSRHNTRTIGSHEYIPFFSHQVIGAVKMKQPIPQVKQSYSKG